MMRLKTAFTLLVALGLLAGGPVGCSDEEEQNDGSSANNNPECPHGTYCPIEGSIHDLFVPEPFGIVMTWFDYTLRSHIVEPVPAVYRGFFDDKSFLFRFESYYDDRGESGKITLTGLELGDDADEAGEVKTLALEGNVKNAPICLKLDGMKEVPCEGGDHDLVIRIEFRTVPTAGFAVSNPSVYTTRHYIDVDGPADADIWQGEFESLDDALAGLEDDTKWFRVKDANLRPADGKITPILEAAAPGEPSEVFIQGTSSMKLVSWWFEKTDDPYEIKLSATCVPTELKYADQATPLSSEAKTQTFELQADTVTLVSLCGDDGPEVVESQDEPYRGFWPPADTFDLFLDTFDKSVQIFVNPGHFIWGSNQAQVDDQTEIPDGFWEEPIW